MTEDYLKDVKGFIHQFEVDYLQDNKSEIEDVISELSFLPDESFMAIGGIMFALSLDDEQRIKMASVWGKTVVEQAKERLPHLKYLQEDFMSKKSLQIDGNALEGLISMMEGYAERDPQKYINANTFIDMKINEFVQIANYLGVIKKARHIDVIQHLFNKFEYEGRFGKEDNVDDLDIQRDTIEKRYYRVVNKDFIHTTFLPPKV